jgi:[protein-PII] uridylyltransferase
MVAKRFTSKGRYKAFALEPEMMINNAWSDRYVMAEVTGLDRPGLLFELTTTLSSGPSIRPWQAAERWKNPP